MPATKEKTYSGHEIVGTVGDIGIAEYDGGIVYRNKDDGELVLEWCEVPPDDIDFDDRDARWTISRVILDRTIPDWGSIKAVARSAGVRPSHLKDDFEDEDPMRQANAFVTWAGYYGWIELDQYPLVLDKDEVENRYNVELGSDDIEENEEEEEP